MSEEFKVEIVNPEKSFFSNDNAIEVVIPAFEGEIGILKDHISIISFLKPGVIKFKSKNSEENFYVEDGIVEFKDNSLSMKERQQTLMKTLTASQREALKGNRESLRKLKDDFAKSLTDEQKITLRQRKQKIKNRREKMKDYQYGFDGRRDNLKQKRQNLRERTKKMKSKR